MTEHFGMDPSPQGLMHAIKQEEDFYGMSTDGEPEERSNGEANLDRIRMMGPLEENPGHHPGMTPPQVTNTLIAEASVSTFTAETNEDLPLDPRRPNPSLGDTRNENMLISKNNSDAKLLSTEAGRKTVDELNTERLDSDDHEEEEEGSDVSSGDTNETQDDKLKPGAKWLESLKEFERYVRENGHGNISQTAKLGRWVNKQRSQKKYMSMGKKTTMTPERVKLLEDAGFTWAKTRLKGPDSWNEHYEELKEFKIKKGNCRVPTRSENTALGRWVTEQRASKKNGTMDKINEKRLNAIGFVWDGNKKRA